ncbi:MAG: DNA-binding protein [Planctomycetes bacterium]|nr:DNA-binding protein [Planctomycetota bacterium]
MSQFYTLEEAASKLNISIDELRELAKKREVRSFQDRGVLRFKSEDIDARLNSSGVTTPESDLEDYTLNLEDTPATNPSDNYVPLGIDTGDSEEFTLSLDDSGTSPPLFNAPIANTADSDGLLGIQDTPDILGSDFSLSTELHSISGPESNSTSSSVILPKDSPFEISEPNIDLDEVSEIQIATNEIDFIPTVDELHLDGEPTLQLDDSNTSDQGLSSSIELQSESGDDSSEFELSVEESGSDVLSLDGSMAGEGGGTQVVEESGSDSEFELNLDEEAGNSLDAEVGAEGGLDSSFELEANDSDSGSQVVEVDDGSDADPMGATAEFNELEVVEDGSSSQVVAIDEVEEVEEIVEEVAEVTEEPIEEVEEDRPLVYAGEVPWGPMPTIFLIPGVLILFVVGLMSLELMRGMYGFNKGTGFTSIIIKPLAEMFTDFPKN